MLNYTAQDARETMEESPNFRGSKFLDFCYNRIISCAIMGASSCRIKLSEGGLKVTNLQIDRAVDYLRERDFAVEYDGQSNSVFVSWSKDGQT